MQSASETLWVEQLQLAQVPTGEWPDLYLLGVPAGRITFTDQQKRAFNLIAALVASGRIDAASTVAIVGAGVAGITAAAYAAQLGIQSTVFDQHSEAMMLQQGSNRWIHPNLYDWPWSRWQVAHTAFPCMNWRAAATAEVVRTLRAEWRQLVCADRVLWMPNVPISSLDRVEGKWRINAGSKRFDAVILAVGFGEEQAQPICDCKSYWRDDDLHQRVRPSSNVLVSGCGDGGLIDALRAVMLDFRHERLFEICSLVKDSLAESIKRIETDHARYPDGAALTAAFLSLDVPAEIDRALVSMLKPSVQLTLNGVGDAPLSRASSAVNRFLIARLVRLGRVSYVPGKVELSSIAAKADRIDVRIGSEQFTFDHLVVRHGPYPPAIDRFASIAASLMPARVFYKAYRDVADRTRQPLWSEILAQVGFCSQAIDGGAPCDVESSRLSYFAEEAQASLRRELNILRANVIVTRADASGSCTLGVETGSGQRVASLSLTFQSRSALVVSVRARSGTATGQSSLAEATDDQELVVQLQRVLRNAAFMIAELQ